MTETLALQTEGEENGADDGKTFVDQDSVASRHHLSEGVQAGARQRGGRRGINRWAAPARISGKSGKTPGRRGPARPQADSWVAVQVPGLVGAGEAGRSGGPAMMTG